MPVIDKYTQGAAPGAAFDLLQASSTSAATFRQGSSAHETPIAISGGVGYLNSWVDFGGSNQAGSYYKDALGRVHLRGTIKSGTIGTTVFTLPAGYRPSAIRNLATVSNGAIGQIDIDSSGNVVARVGSNVWFSLEVSFDI